MFKRFLYILLILFFTITSSALGADFKITDVKLDHSENVILLNGKTSSADVNYRAGFSQEPIRAYIDLEDCVFPENKKILEFKNKPINKVAIAQFSTHPNKVRLVFYSNSVENLKKIKLIKNGNALTFKLQEFNYGGYSIPIVFSDLLPKQYKNLKANTNNNIQFSKYILTAAYQTQAGVLLSGVGNVKLSRPFILTNPIRIVFDMQNATVLSKDLYQEYKLNNGDTIKIGQFNTDTLRFVVTTNNPVDYKSYISPDLQSVFINNINEEKVGALPNTNVMSVLKRVNLKVVSPKETYITITFDKPIIPSFRRTYNKFLIDFLNVDFDSNAEFMKANTTAQFGGFSTQKTTPTSTKLSVLFPVNDNLKVETGLSLDGKVLSIRLIGSLHEEATDNKQVVQFPRQSLNYTLKNKVIVVDAGHGGKDAGAISGKMYEKVPALDMSLMLKKQLENRGAKVIMTRSDDTFVTLQDRVSISNYENADAFVSIHLNSSEKTQIHGIETHWYKPNSQSLARYVQNHMIKDIKANDRGLFKSMFYVINHTTAPAILVETGFISNREERDELFKRERQEATAKAIADGISEYFIKR